MRKETKCIAILRKAKEPKGKKAHYQAKQSPNQMENKPKPEANHLQMAPNLAGVAHTSPEAHQTKIRPGWLWCAYTPTGTFRAHLSRAASYRHSKGGCQGLVQVQCTNTGWFAHL
jgi:hypothetical protein